MAFDSGPVSKYVLLLSRDGTKIMLFANIFCKKSFAKNEVSLFAKIQLK